ncbi:MAG: ligand-binding sensor domain-containing protein, partial [Tangfeifania sp.]
MKSIILVVFFIIVGVGFSSADDFRYLSTDDGLTDGEINSIVQDSTGNMWFATWSGLMKYDGYSIELFRPELDEPESLPDKKIKKLFIDSKDNLWIATSTNLCMYEKNTKSFQTCSFEGVENNTINILNLYELKDFLIVHAVQGLFLMPLEKCKKGYQAKLEKLLMNGVETNYYFHYSRSYQDKLLLVSNNYEGSAQINFAELIVDGEKTNFKITTTKELNGL